VCEGQHLPKPYQLPRGVSFAATCAGESAREKLVWSPLSPNRDGSFICIGRRPDEMIGMFGSRVPGLTAL